MEVALEKQRGSRSLVSRAHSRSVNIHQRAFEPTLPQISLRPFRGVSTRSQLQRSVRVATRLVIHRITEATRHAVDICHGAFGAKGILICVRDLASSRGKKTFFTRESALFAAANTTRSLFAQHHVQHR